MTARLTTDRNDPRLPVKHGPDTECVPQQHVYLVLSDEERAKGFVRPVRTQYRHVGVRREDGSPLPYMTGCGKVTTMAQAIAETIARDPGFYQGTYCAHCGMHRPLEEFRWLDGSQVGA